MVLIGDLARELGLVFYVNGAKGGRPSIRFSVGILFLTNDGAVLVLETSHS